MEGVLDRELKVNKILQCALQGPIQSCPCLCSVLPVQVQELLTELIAVEEEITWLERKVDELKLSLYREKQQTQLFEGEQLIELQPQWSHKKQKHLLSSGREETVELNSFELPLRLESYDEYRTPRERRDILRSSTDVRGMSLTMANGYIADGSTCLENSHLEEEITIEKPNMLSEELLRCFIGIYIKLNHNSLGSKGSAMVPVIGRNWYNNILEVCWNYGAKYGYFAKNTKNTG